MTSDELGAEVAYTAVKSGTPVYDRDRRRIGVVDDVIQTEDIFEGIIVRTRPLPGHHLYASPDQVADMRERGVQLSVTQGDLREPVGSSRRRRAQQGGLGARLRKAVDWIVGR